MRSLFGESLGGSRDCAILLKGLSTMLNLTRLSEFVRRVRGGFVGLAVGDALGVPVELYTHDEIMGVTDGQGVTGYMEPSLTRIKDTQGLPKGSTSDDTQLARVTGRSLARRRSFDIVDQGFSLVDEFERSVFGWGGTTTAAAKAMKLWRDTKGKVGRHPETPAPPPTAEFPAAGSGPAMKVFPLAAWDLFGRDQDVTEPFFLWHAMDLGFMTHGDTRACIASYALGQAIAAFAEDDDVTWSTLTEAAHAEAVANRVIERVVRTTMTAEGMYRFMRPATPPFSDPLRKAIMLRGDAVKLRKEINTSFLASASVPFAIATALRYPNNFRAAVLEGINGGQDTDTVGSMIGAMVGSRVGIEGIPPEWLDGLLDLKVILKEADEFCAAAFGIDPLDAKRIIPPWEREKAH